MTFHISRICKNVSLCNNLNLNITYRKCTLRKIFSWYIVKLVCSNNLMQFCSYPRTTVPNERTYVQTEGNCYQNVQYFVKNILWKISSNEPLLLQMYQFPSAYVSFVYTLHWFYDYLCIIVYLLDTVTKLFSWYLNNSACSNNFMQLYSYWINCG